MILGAIDILAEDGEFVAVSKPPEISSIPDPNFQVSAAELCADQLGLAKVFAVHRLDYEVSGVLLFAKSAAAHRYLNDLFAARKVQKCYRAVCHGAVSPESGEINASIRSCGSGRMAVDKLRGKTALTKYALINSSGRFSTLELMPLTGRRHQLRVHLYSIGHPIVGDLRYGDAARQKIYPRLMLHATSVSFLAPDGHEFCARSEAPDSFEYATWPDAARQE